MEQLRQLAGRGQHPCIDVLIPASRPDGTFFEPLPEREETPTNLMNRWQQVQIREYQEEEVGHDLNPDRT